MLKEFEFCFNNSDKYIHVENDGSYLLQRDGGVLEVYFQCSNSEEDWKNNFNFPAKPYRDMKDAWFCHRGFLKVWKSVEPHIQADIMDPTVTEIHIVGYSHGAALAQLCHEYVKFNRPDVIVRGLGFGSPRVVWGPMSKEVKKRFEGFTVVRNGNDIVTHLPPVIFGFRHICKVVKIGESEGLIKDHYPDRYAEALYFHDMQTLIDEDVNEVM